MKICTNRSNYFVYKDDECEDSIWVVKLTEDLRETLLSFTGMARARSHANYKMFVGTSPIDCEVLRIPMEEFDNIFKETTAELEDGMGFIDGEDYEVEWLKESYEGLEPILTIGTDGFFAIATRDWHMPNPIGIDWFCDYCFDTAA